MSAAHIMVMVDGAYVPWDGTTASVGEGGGGLDQATADALYVSVDGDTVNGDLTVTGLLLVDSAYTAAAALDRGSPTQYCHFEFRTAGVQKWTAGLRANELDRFTLYNSVYDVRALDIDGVTGLVKVADDPTDDLGVATKQYVDAAAGGGGGGTSGVRAAPNLWTYAWGNTVGTDTYGLSTSGCNASRVELAVPMKAIAFEVTTDAPLALAQVCVYDDAYPWPGSLIWSAPIDSAVKGVKQFPVDLPVGAYWLTIANPMGAQLVMRRSNISNPYSPGQKGPYAINSLAYGAMNITGQPAGPPAVWPQTSHNDNTAPVWYLQAA